MTLVNFAPRPTTRSNSYPRRITTTAFRNTPLVNINELADAFQIELAIPGVPKDQITLDVKDDQLIIEGIAEAPEDQSSKIKYLRKEYDFKTFKKVYTLTDEIDQSAIDASLNDGILTVTLNKKEEAKAIPPRSISIQ